MAKLGRLTFCTTLHVKVDVGVELITAGDKVLAVCCRSWHRKKIIISLPVVVSMLAGVS